MSAGRAIATAVKAASRNKVVRGLATAAGTAAARKIGPIAEQRYGTWRDRRIDRDRAIRLARQVKGRYSEGTIIDGERHFVVWKDGAPINAFPHVDDLRDRPELRDFNPELTREPPPARQRPGRRPRGQQ